MSATDHERRLVERIAGYGNCVVAFSAGVDSTVVAKAAQLALGDRAVAVTGASASLAAGELDEARALAALIGIRHEVISTDEFADPHYIQNPSNRCYYCKTELYGQLERLLTKLGMTVIANGANLDDLGDYRPGMIAAGEHSVRSPLDLNLLLLGDQPIAFAYNYHYCGYVYGLRIGFDPAASTEGAGTVLQRMMIEDSCRRGDQILDLGPGSAECKRFWQTRIVGVSRLTHFAASSPRAQALRLLHRLKRGRAPRLAN